MLKKLFFGFLAIALLNACKSDCKGDCCKKDGAGTTAVDPKADGKHFGEIITAEGAITADELLPKMATIDSLPIKVTGTVGAVCQKKGCWMMLVPTTAGAKEVRVTFKDYAFFMPKDLTGKKVILDGFARVETTSVEMLQHFAKDDGKSEAEIAKITTPEKELNYEAKGVVILD
jgi:hypothetical protein